jgi:hypothetical protein
MDVTGLTPSTTYHFRVVASNPFGASVAPDQTFTTGPEAAVLPPPGKTACKKGQVQHNGKCAKRHKHRKRHRRGARR